MIVKNNNLYKLVLGLVVVLLIILGYFYYQEPQSAETIKIGATLALTGKFAFLGEAEANGMKLAVEEINTSGGINGKKLKLIIEDNQGDAKTAVLSITKLLDVDKVDIVVSAFTHITNAIKSLVAEKEKIMLHITTARDIAESNDLFFRDYFDAGDHGQALADLVNKSGYKKIAFLTEISDQCIQLEKAFNQAASEFQIQTIMKEAYNTTEQDLRTNLLKIKQSSPEAIVICGWRHEHIIMRQLKEQGMISFPTFHWTGPFMPISDTEDMRKLFEENKAVSTWYGITDSTAIPKQKEFIKKYQQRFSAKPMSDAGYIYDDIYVLAEAIKKCDRKKSATDSKCLSGELLKTDYSGVSGKLTFNEKGLSNREVTSIKVVNGTWVEIPN